jgi:ribosome-interacting GTPase 1
MPTNVTPEFKKAQAAFRAARDTTERLNCLKEMLRTIPKHKGTEHLQADIKTRIKALTAELAAPKKKGARTGPAHTVNPEGAAQVALIGPPNAGKSSLHARLTGSQAEVGPYPHATQAPLPGMFPHKDVFFQLVDLPPVSASFMDTWIPNALQPAHAVLLVVDLNAAGCVENVAAIIERLDAKRISLVKEWRGKLGFGYQETIHDAEDRGRPGEDDPATSGDSDELEDAFRIFLPTLFVANKCDLKRDPAEIDVLEELIGMRYPAIFVSAKTGEGVDQIGTALFRGLEIVRVYTKIPGRPADTGTPYTLFRGDTVIDVARLVHRDIAKSLKFARIWGSAKFKGQQVGKDHVVCDGDVIELHS